MLIKQGQMTYDTSRMAHGGQQLDQLNDRDYIQHSIDDIFNIAEGLPKYQREMVLAVWYKAHAYRKALNMVGLTPSLLQSDDEIILNVTNDSSHLLNCFNVTKEY